jgi:predicted transcriptional regulator
MKTTIDWNSSEINQMFVDKNDCEISKVLGVSRQRVHQVRKKFKIASLTSRRKNSIITSGLIGTQSDRSIGIFFGEEERYVTSIRRRLKIKSIKRSKLDEYAHLLGKVSDNRISKMANVSQSAVSNYRRRKNINPFQKRVYKNDFTLHGTDNPTKVLVEVLQ